MSEFFGHPDAPVMVKAFAAALAGRVLRLMAVRRIARIPLAKRIGLAVLEIPIVAAFGLLGWHTGGALGLASEDARVVVTVLVAFGGVEALSALALRFLPPGTGR